ncbi:hypothetical protein PSHT_13738 [Puccinia striiformis]|uniref:Uncharacterized protein n=1 Tax=Puccinia striiformis TaxID=27350 RepID=A0A2S4UPS6_9BASI|nr:hypothetical protein PSHT_13738 [Puccinia striiformis]
MQTCTGRPGYRQHWEGGARPGGLGTPSGLIAIATPRSTSTIPHPNVQSTNQLRVPDGIGSWAIDDDQNPKKNQQDGHFCEAALPNLDGSRFTANGRWHFLQSRIGPRIFFKGAFPVSLSDLLKPDDQMLDVAVTEKE